MLLSRLIIAGLGVTMVAGVPMTTKTRDDQNQQDPSLDSDSALDLPKEIFQVLVLVGISLEAARRIWLAGVQEGLSRQGPPVETPATRNADNGMEEEEEIRLKINDLELTIEEYHLLALLTGDCIRQEQNKFEELSEIERVKILLELGLSANLANRASLFPLIAHWKLECSKKSLGYIKFRQSMEPKSARSTKKIKSVPAYHPEQDQKPVAQGDESDGEELSSSSFDIGQKVQDLSQPLAAGLGAGLLTGAVGLATMGNDNGASAWQGD